MSLGKGSDGEILIRGARFPEFCLFSHASDLFTADPRRSYREGLAQWPPLHYFRFEEELYQRLITCIIHPPGKTDLLNPHSSIKF